MSQAEIDRLFVRNAGLIRMLEKVAAWLDRLAYSSEQQATASRFVTLTDACTADAKNYRATAKDIRTAISEGEVTR